MSEYTCFIDESGCKQRARTPIADPLDIGVAVGVVVPSEKEKSFSQEIASAILSLGVELKDDTHVTDVSSVWQESVRKKVYDVVRRYEAELYWQAISASGFQRWEVGITDAAVNSAKNDSNPNIAIVGNPENPSAHATLIAGVVEKALACYDQVMFMTDEVDAKILNEAQNKVDEVFRSGPTTYTVNAYDKCARTRLTGKIVSTCIGLEPVAEKKWDLKILPKNNGGILAADVIANALLYHLNAHVKSGGETLNDKAAIRGFDLAELCRCAEGGCPDIGDTLYALRKCTGGVEA